MIAARFALLGTFCALLTACPHRHSNSPVKTLSDIKRDCEQRIRAQMKAGTLHLAHLDGTPLLKDVDALNARIDSLGGANAEFQVQRVSGKMTSLGVNHQTDSGDFSANATLSRADADTAFLYNLNLEVDDRPAAHQTRQIQEAFNVTQDCQLQIESATIDLTTLDGQHLTMREVVHHADDRAGSSSDQNQTFEIPANGHLVDAMESQNLKSLEDMEQLLNKYKGKELYLATNLQMGLMRFDSKTIDPAGELDPFTNQTEIFKGVELLMDLKGEGQLNLRFKETSSGSPNYVEVEGTNAQTWTVAPEIWERTDLSDQGSEGIHTYEVESGLTQDNAVGAIQTTRKLDYDNLAAYWRILRESDLKNDSKGWTWQAIMKPVFWTAADPATSAPLASSADRSGPDAPYLAESDFVHYNIPQLQSLLKELEPDRNLNRMQMAEKILGVVQKTIKYDFTSSKGNAIYPLSTEDILARKDGVCQHFAVLFASLARAEGIPTKLIVGYLLADKGKAGAHAWNEIEVQPGVWRPIEPQAGGLDFSSYSYIPISEAYILEYRQMDKNQLESAEALMTTQFDLHLQPGS